MPGSEPTMAEWKALLAAAVRVKDVAPWMWMTETDIFGVQDPETGELGFVSVMGMMGVHYAVAVYIGRRGLRGFWRLQSMEWPANSPELMFEIPFLQASFEDRQDLSPSDYRLIKKSGFKFWGRSAWPLFRSYRPGYFPWYLEPWEARFLTHALEQTVEVAMRFKEDPDLLKPRARNRYLVRVPQVRGETVTWSDKEREIRLPRREKIRVILDPDQLLWAKQLPRSRATFEVDCFAMPARVGKRGERPFVPYLLLVADARTGAVLGSDVLKPVPDMMRMWGEVPEALVEQLRSIRVLPETIRTRGALLAELLRTVTEELGIELKRVQRLRAVDAFKAFYMQQLR